VNRAIECVAAHQSCQPREREYHRKHPKHGSHPHGDYWLCFLYNRGENVKTCVTLECRIDLDERPQPIPLDLENPLWMGKPLPDSGKRHGLELREGHLQQYIPARHPALGIISVNCRQLVEGDFNRTHHSGAYELGLR
jgi:hypothetical protein